MFFLSPLTPLTGVVVLINCYNGKITYEHKTAPGTHLHTIRIRQM